MKAWHVFSGDPCESSLLVFAETNGKARAMALYAGLWEYGDYIDIGIKRAKAWDGMADAGSVIETNNEIKEGFPPFYADEDETWL